MTQEAFYDAFINRMDKILTAMVGIPEKADVAEVANIHQKELEAATEAHVAMIVQSDFIAQQELDMRAARIELEKKKLEVDALKVEAEVQELQRRLASVDSPLKLF